MSKVIQSVYKEGFRGLTPYIISLKNLNIDIFFSSHKTIYIYLKPPPKNNYVYTLSGNDCYFNRVGFLKVLCINILILSL